MSYEHFSHLTFFPERSVCGERKRQSAEEKNFPHFTFLFIGEPECKDFFMPYRSTGIIITFTNDVENIIFVVSHRL